MRKKSLLRLFFFRLRAPDVAAHQSGRRWRTPDCLMRRCMRYRLTARSSIGYIPARLPGRLSGRHLTHRVPSCFRRFCWCRPGRGLFILRPRFHVQFPCSLFGWTRRIAGAQSQQTAHQGQNAVSGMPGVSTFRLCRDVADRPGAGAAPFVQLHVFVIEILHGLAHRVAPVAIRAGRQWCGSRPASVRSSDQR